MHRQIATAHARREHAIGHRRDMDRREEAEIAREVVGAHRARGRLALTAMR